MILVSMYKHGELISNPIPETFFLIRDCKGDTYRVESNFSPIFKENPNLSSEVTIKNITHDPSAEKDLEAVAKELSSSSDIGVTVANSSHLTYESILPKLFDYYAQRLVNQYTP